MILARIGRGNNDADRFLIEALETAMALKIFEVTSNGAFLEELIELLLGDEAGRQQPLHALAAHGPTFAFRESLAQKFEIGEGFHRRNPAIFQLGAQLLKIEPRFQMVHAGLQKAFAVQADPKPDRTEPGSGRKFLGGEINLGLFWHQVHVGEHNDSNYGLLANLSAPARFSAGVIAFPLLKPEFLEKGDQVHKMLARTPERVMIVISPAEAKLVLAELLNAPGVIAALPVGTLGLEEKLASQIASY